MKELPEGINATKNEIALEGVCEGNTMAVISFEDALLKQIA